jgi:hypothetical protein
MDKHKENQLKKQRDIMAKRMLEETEEQRQIRLEQNRERTRKRRTEEN